MPAAWPIAMHVPIERADACASCVAEKHRPATSTFSSRCGCKRAVRDAVRRAVLQVDPARVVAGVMLLDRRAAARDLIGELRRGQDLVGGQNVLADDPPALAHADRGARRESTARS